MTPRQIIEELVAAVEDLPMDSIICYASTVKEYKPNAMVKRANDALSAARAFLAAPEAEPDALDVAEQRGYERGLSDAPGSKLIDAWVALTGKPISWTKAVQIIAITCKIPDEERDRLLALEDTP
jgi:hypothetical protein